MLLPPLRANAIIVMPVNTVRDEKKKGRRRKKTEKMKKKAGIYEFEKTDPTAQLNTAQRTPT